MKELPKNPEGFMTKFGREAKKFAHTAGFAAAIGSANAACEGPGCHPDESTEINRLKERAEAEAEGTETRQIFFDSNPDYLRHIPGGEFTKQERAERTETMPNGEKIFHDIGLDFYYVEKGDTISEVQTSLGLYDQYSYLKTQKIKLQSFNIPSKKFRAGMWVPIPLENESRHISEEQLAEYAGLGIKEILEDKKYGDEVKDILDIVSTKELIATIIAIAKQESGGQPIGKFTFHRWEDHQKAFSFSLFHVLMKGPGLKARHQLELTEGQTYHPQNATKLLLAFMVEKAAETKIRPDVFFPIDQHLEEFAVFYNGSHWKKTNPGYTDNIMRYYAEALDELE